MAGETEIKGCAQMRGRWLLLVTLSLVAEQLAAENSTVVLCDDHADDAHHRRLETATVPEVDEGGAHWTSRHRLERRTATIGFALAVWAGGKVVIMCSFTFVLKRDGYVNHCAVTGVSRRETPAGVGGGGEQQQQQDRSGGRPAGAVRRHLRRCRARPARARLCAVPDRFRAARRARPLPARARGRRVRWAVVPYGNASRSRRRMMRMMFIHCFLLHDSSFHSFLLLARLVDFVPSSSSSNRMFWLLLE